MNPDLLLTIGSVFGAVKDPGREVTVLSRFFFFFANKTFSEFSVSRTSPSFPPLYLSGDQPAPTF